VLEIDTLSRLILYWKRLNIDGLLLDVVKCVVFQLNADHSCYQFIPGSKSMNKSKTKLCDLLGIKYPIIEAAMAWCGDAELAAAVSNAGGVGTIGPNGGQKSITRDVYETGERLRGQIRKAKSLTDRPFAVNFPIGMGKDREYSDQCVEVGIEERVPVAIISEGNPVIYTQRFKDAGAKVLHVIHTAEHAKKAEEAGVDAVITSGTEGGGHSGFEQVTTFVGVPTIASAVAIPVVAGGGIADGRGLIAALALGAEGIYMGTRFIATKECNVHTNYKQMILDATEVDTVSIGHGPGRALSAGLRTKVVGVHTETESPFPEERRGSLRVIFNEFARQCLEKAASKEYTIDEVQAFINSPAPGWKDCSRTTGSLIHGDVVNCGIAAGQEVSMINDIPSCQELIDRIINEAGQIISQINGITLT
jgi:NAD(P)H-dependent flavin oxidoreductase YrpB (nitropropane dioxygenase family)